mmetsp:Transcript_89357/g.177652  ORF Transcript_89357/g.177652 Transcript_89357/m.177652 type:complete len:240 (+) Transcript_89357:484-1203(+)
MQHRLNFEADDVFHVAMPAVSTHKAVLGVKHPQPWRTPTFWKLVGTKQRHRGHNGRPIRLQQVADGWPFHGERKPQQPRCQSCHYQNTSLSRPHQQNTWPHLMRVKLLCDEDVQVHRRVAGPKPRQWHEGVLHPIYLEVSIEHVNAEPRAESQGRILCDLRVHREHRQTAQCQGFTRLQHRGRLWQEQCPTKEAKLFGMPSITSKKAGSGRPNERHQHRAWGCNKHRPCHAQSCRREMV